MADFDLRKSSEEARDPNSEEETDEPRAEPETEWTFKNFLLKRVLPGAAIGVTAVVAAPLALGAIGFGAGGIVGGSFAAGMMSSAAIANGGGVAAGGLVAVLQSAGAAGISAAANAGIFTAVTATATGVVEAGSRIKDKMKEKINDDRRNNCM